jgi:hypothetical protein
MVGGSCCLNLAAVLMCYVAALQERQSLTRHLTSRGR